LEGLVVGREILVFTWFHEADRELLKVHPRGDINRPIRGVFSTRSPDRPNPIGLHRVVIVEIQDNCRIRVRPLEALDGTPLVDIKPVMLECDER
jgi:tRNA-Thr(GGU) m(6)t(6)A37 methyltransferase TsaA